MKVFDKSNYHIAATGFRGLTGHEFYSIIKIIRSDNINYESELNKLYEYCPATIDLDKYQQEHSCPMFCEECDCFLPDIDEIYCRKKRREQIEQSNNRKYPEYVDWRKKVFERDNYKCQKCGVRGGDLNAHHILSYKDHPSERINIQNGITLCEKCHKKQHSQDDKIYGNLKYER